MDEDEMVLDRIPLAGKNTFEGETIEDLLAQFETESKSRAVSCPNCKECCPKKIMIKTTKSLKTISTQLKIQLIKAVTEKASDRDFTTTILPFLLLQEVFLVCSVFCSFYNLFFSS